jgi:hypothetical protein
MGRQRVAMRALLVPQIGRLLAGCARQADRGNRGAPVPGCRIQDAKVRYREPRQDVFVDGAHAMVHPTRFMALADLARHNGAAMRRGDIRVLGMESRGFTQSPLEHGGFAIVAHHLVGHPAPERPSLLMTGPKMRQGLWHGPRDSPQAAGAQPHDKEAQTAMGLPHRDRAEGAPVDLGPRPGGKGECEQSGLPLGVNRAPRGFDDGVATREAWLAPALDDVGGARRICVAHRDHRRLERSECTGPRTCLARSKALLAAPRGDGAGIERPGVGHLRDVEPLLLMERFDLTKPVIIAQDNPSQMRAPPALMAPGSASAAPVEALWVDSMGSVSRAKTWDRGC